jgi:hypothetical protein
MVVPLYFNGANFKQMSLKGVIQYPLGFDPQGILIPSGIYQRVTRDL